MLPAKYKYWEFDQRDHKVSEQVSGSVLWEGLSNGEIKRGYLKYGTSFNRGRVVFPSDGVDYFSDVTNLSISVLISDLSPVARTSTICGKAKYDYTNQVLTRTWTLSVDADGMPCFITDSFTIKGWYRVDDRFAHELSVISHDGFLKLLVDGLVVGQVSGQLIPRSSATKFIIGNIDIGTEKFDGIIERVAMWDDSHGTPTPDQIAESLYDPATMRVVPVYPTEGEYNVIPTINTQIEFWIEDSVNYVDPNSLYVYVLPYRYQYALITNGTANAGVTVNSTWVAGKGLHVWISWDKSTYKYPWNAEVPVFVAATNGASQVVRRTFAFLSQTDNDAPIVQNTLPAHKSMRTSVSTAVYFEIFDAVSGVNMSSIEVYVDLTGIGDFQLIYKDSAFTPGFSGTVEEDATDPLHQVNVTIDTVNFEPDTLVHFKVAVQDEAVNYSESSFWFKTVEILEDIKETYPQDHEDMVVLGQDIAINYKFDDPDTVIVSGTLAYDRTLTPSFRNGWSGWYLDDDRGKRLVMAPPSSFPVGTTVTVTTSAGTHTKEFSYRVGSDLMTSGGKSSIPRITEAGSADTWVGYIRNGALVLRKGNPASPETTVIPASMWDHGYDPVLGKYILYWTDNGKVFYSTADPGDSPETLVQPSTLSVSVSNGMLGGSDLKTVSRLPYVPPDPMIVGDPELGDLKIVITAPTNVDPDATIVGYDIMVVWYGVPVKMSYAVYAGDLTFAPLPPLTYGAKFYVVPVYDIGGELLRGAPSGQVSAPDYGGVVATAGVGGSDLKTLESTVFLPLSFFVPNTLLDGGIGGSSISTLVKFSYDMDKYAPLDSVKASSGGSSLATLKVGGVGVIGVG